MPQVRNDLTGRRVTHDGARRNHCLDVIAGGALLSVRAAWLTGVRDIAMCAVQEEQAIQAGIDDKVNAAATPAIAAVRPAAWLEFFAVKVGHAIAALPTFDEDARLIVEHNELPSREALTVTQASNACLCVDLICCLLTKAPQAGLSNSNGTSGERTRRAVGEKGIARPSEV